MDQNRIEQESPDSDRQKSQNASIVAKQEGPRPRSSKRALFLLVPIILAIAGYFIYEAYFANQESTDDAQIDGQPAVDLSRGERGLPAARLLHVAG